MSISSHPLSTPPSSLSPFSPTPPTQIDPSIPKSTLPIWPNPYLNLFAHLSERLSSDNYSIYLQHYELFKHCLIETQGFERGVRNHFNMINTPHLEQLHQYLLQEPTLLANVYSADEYVRLCGAVNVVIQPYREVDGSWIHVVFDGLLTAHLTNINCIKEERTQRVLRGQGAE